MSASGSTKDYTEANSTKRLGRKIWLSAGYIDALRIRIDERADKN